MNGSSGCYHCPDRTVGCHGRCEKYAAWLASERERMAVEKNARIENMTMVNYLRSAVERQKKRMGRHKWNGWK